MFGMKGFKLRIDIIMPEPEFPECEECGKKHDPEEECPVEGMYNTDVIPELFNNEATVDSEYIKKVEGKNGNKGS